jgi:hypothetical protein
MSGDLDSGPEFIIQDAKLRFPIASPSFQDPFAECVECFDAVMASTTALCGDSGATGGADLVLVDEEAAATVG